MGFSGGAGGKGAGNSSDYSRKEIGVIKKIYDKPRRFSGGEGSAGERMGEALRPRPRRDGGDPAAGGRALYKMTKTIEGVQQFYHTIRAMEAIQ